MRKMGGFALCLGLALSLFLPGCGNKYAEAVNGLPEETGQTQAEKPVEVTAAQEETKAETEYIPQERIAVDGKIQSYLTGEIRAVEQADRRPLAVMISNDKESWPHYGMGRAGVIYEVPVEGEMNRYMALLEDYDGLERIGSVRSCRNCYIDFAKEFDAIYAHYGQSTFAKPYLDSIDNINGIEGKGAQAFFRSKDKKSPHNAYTSFQGIQKAIQALGYSQEYGDGYEGHYQFARPDEPVTLDFDTAVEAGRIEPGYTMYHPYFQYEEGDGLYHRYQSGAPEQSDEGPLAVKNVIIQYCQSGYYANTQYQNFNVETSEWGYYATNGKAVPVSWKKEKGVTRYYGPDGEEIRLNPGKTWVCILSTKYVDRTEFYGN